MAIFNGVRVSVKVQPRSSRQEVVENADGSLKVYIKASPVEGKANRELIQVLSDYYKVKKSDIVVKSGLISRKKIIEIRSV